MQCHLDCPARRKWNRAKTRNQARPRVPAKKMGCPVRPFVAIGQTVPLLFWYLDTDTPEDLYIFHFWVASSSCHGSREDASARHFLVAEAQQKTSAELGAINGVATKGEMEPMAELEIGV